MGSPLCLIFLTSLFPLYSHAARARGRAPVQRRRRQLASRATPPVAGEANPSSSAPPLAPPPLLLVRGIELLKRTRKGSLHWKDVSVYINRTGMVMLKMKSRHVAGTITKKKSANIKSWMRCGENSFFHDCVQMIGGIANYDQFSCCLVRYGFSLAHFIDRCIAGCYNLIPWGGVACLHREHSLGSDLQKEIISKEKRRSKKIIQYRLSRCWECTAHRNEYLRRFRQFFIRN